MLLLLNSCPSCEAVIYPEVSAHRFAGSPVSQGMSVAKSAIATRSIELEPIDRLEEKVKLLVGMVDRLRTENASASEENARLTRELESSRARLVDAESTGSEILALREERDLIRSRVDEMLQQIEGLNL